MKRKICVFVVLILCLFFATSTVAMAMNTGFAVEEISQESIDVFLSNAELTLLTSSPTKEAIQCFDISEKGLIAICQQSSFNKKEICVYSSSGKFLYGYKLKNYGDNVLEWDKGNLNIYFVRSDFIVSVDANGEVVNVKKAKEGQENYKYSEKMKSKTQQVVDDTEYILENKLGIFNLFTVTHSQIIVKNADGEETLIYDVNSRVLFNLIVKTVFYVAFVSIVITVVIRQCIKAKKYNNRL